jgi:hypothetical protein
MRVTGRGLPTMPRGFIETWEAFVFIELQPMMGFPQAILLQNNGSITSPAFVA